MTALCETAARDERRAPVAPLGYSPRQAERTVLHQVVRENLETVLATAPPACPPRYAALHLDLASSACHRAPRASRSVRTQRFVCV